MGCNCKSVEKLKKTQLFSTKNERIGVWGRINAMSINFLNKFIILSLLIILTPIIIIVLIINFLFGIGLMLPLPKFMSKYHKKIKENE